ncbi:effector-associated domain EAD1-containing protein [Dactylosporangium sp. NPDC049742]|uniref:effector-associated domain EAD1-containing protein n=1 Tax=Dactylosporangium sp. NPDC049742 TaxID=3154737 RepID=UPI00343379ED
MSTDLANALRAAFDPPERFDELLLHLLDVRRTDLTMAGTYPQRIFQVVLAAEASGWLEDLVVAALQVRPRDPDLVAAAATLGVLHGPPAAGAPATPDILARFGALQWQVSPPAVLVGADLCVVAGRDPAPVDELRFDHRTDAAGHVIDAGTTVAVTGWSTLSTGGPALARLAEPIGELPVGRAGLVAGADVRGWLEVRRTRPTVGEPLLLATSCGCGGIQLSSVVVEEAGPTIIRYTGPAGLLLGTDFRLAGVSLDAGIAWSGPITVG